MNKFEIVEHHDMPYLRIESDDDRFFCDRMFRGGDVIISVPLPIKAMKDLNVSIDSFLLSKDPMARAQMGDEEAVSQLWNDSDWADREAVERAQIQSEWAYQEQRDEG